MLSNHPIIKSNEDNRDVSCTRTTLVYYINVKVHILIMIHIQHFILPYNILSDNW